jgi:DNA-binding NarL/FixJ family response regulator
MVSAEGTFCQETQDLLENAEGITVLQAETGAEIVNPLPDLLPDLVLLDLDTAPFNPAELVTKLGQQHPGAKIVVLSSMGREESVLHALREGARGHLIKGAQDGDDLVATLRAVHRGDSILTPTMAGVILDEINYRYQLVRSALPAVDHKARTVDALSTSDRARE